MPINPESGRPPEPEQELTVQQTDTGPKPLTFEEVVSPEHLEMISQASGGFRFRPDASLPPGRTGYTDLRTRTIFYNPLMLAGNEELGIKPWTKTDIEGFTYHEAGHHAPEVVALQEKLIGHLKHIEVPEAYKGSPAAEERFIQAIWSNLDNALADIWLERLMGKRPYFGVEKSISEFQEAKGDIDDYKAAFPSKPGQLMQALLRSRYVKEKGKVKTRKGNEEYLEYIEGKKEGLDPDVFEAMQKIIKSGAMQAMIERGAFENYFASPTQREKLIDKKMEAYKQVFLPEYLRLLEKELEERKKQRQQQKQKEQQGEQGEQDEQEQQGEQGEGQPQVGPSEGAPLTREEEEELKQQIIEELEKAGKEWQSQAPAEEDEKELNSEMEKVRKKIEREQKQKEGGEPEEGEEAQPEEGKEGEEKEEKPEPKKKSGEEAIKELAKEFERKQKEANRKGAAEALQVTPETVKKWERIKEDYELDIESLTAALAGVFLDDRRKKMEYLRREGDIVPGLEFETIAAHIAGESDPSTKMSVVRNPEFLETELEFIVDTSGSMSGEKIDRSIDLMVIITEALKRVKETLSQENLLTEKEQPFRLGATKFSNLPERVTKLTDPINDKKEVTIIEEVSKIGGDTEESGAIRQVYEELKLNKANVIKIIVVLTDGEGNRGAVEPIIQQIENDNEIVLLAVGMGSSKEDAEAIVKTYLDPLRKQEEANVHGFAAQRPEEALPATIEFLKREINKRKQ